MIRRSTLVFLTCLSALSLPVSSAQATSSMLIAQAVEGSLIEDAGTASNVLSIGDRGPAVRSLQIRLTDTGYYSGPIDGIYGLATQRSVRDFQESQDFDVTGRLDNATWEALESADEAGSDPVESVNANDSDSSTDGSTSAGDAPANELSDVSQPTAPVVVAPEAEPSGGGLGRVFGLGLGLAALVSSFGVGFFIANRGKDDVAADEDDSWGGLSADDSDAALTNGSVGVQPVSPVANLPVQSGANSGGGLAQSNNALATSGQMGGTSLMAQSDVVDGLIKDLHNPDPTKRRKVIWELGQRGNSLAVNPLVDAMVTADSKEKSLVLAALSEIGIRSLKPMNRALAIALQDENPEVRKNAIRDLTRIYELVVQISQMLGHATEDEDPEVRQTASWALEQLNRIRRTQDVDSTMRAFPGGGAKPIDLLSSEASIRRSQS